MFLCKVYRSRVPNPMVWSSAVEVREKNPASAAMSAAQRKGPGTYRVAVADAASFGSDGRAPYKTFRVRIY